MRAIVEAMQERMHETGAAVAYCTGGHGHTWVDAATVEGDSHGACPGPVLVMEPNPDAVPEAIEGGVRREAPPCSRCMHPTTVDPDTLRDVDGSADPIGMPFGEEMSFTLQEATPDGGVLVGDPMTVCLRCLAGALASPTPFALLEVRGRAVPWR